MFSRHQFLPRLEELGARITPAGSLTTSFKSGTLTITGDALSQNIALLGGSQGHVSISVVDGTTSISGRNSFNKVKTLILNMGDGDDTVTMVDLKLAKKTDRVTINMGNGNNTLLYDGEVTNVNSLKVTNGTGKFSLLPQTRIRSLFGQIEINCASSSDCQIYLWGGGVAKTTKITTGGGNDVVSIEEYIFAGDVTINTGAGNDAIYMGMLDDPDHEQSTDGEEVVFQKKLTVNMGAGNDLFVAGIDVHRFTPLIDDDNPDFVRFKGLVTIDGGDNFDRIWIHHPQGVEFTFEGAPELNNFEYIGYPNYQLPPPVLPTDPDNGYSPLAPYQFPYG